jgi:hypothetical protein
MLSCLTTVVLFLLVLHAQLDPVACSLEVYGSVGAPDEPRDSSAVTLSYFQCFLGLYFSTCRIVDQYDDDYLMMNALPYYRNFNDFYGEAYCLQCCGGGTDVDYWNLRCETSDGGPVTDMYGYEVRFARNKFPGDIELIWCPIQRSICEYNETTNTETCDERLVRDDETYLHGITIELHVKMIYYAQSSWRQVTSCNVTADERNYSLALGDEFEENYIMHHEIGHYEYDAVGYFLLFLLGFILVYAALYYCRRQRCYVCEKKLVFFKDRCYLCRFYGAHMPDPELIKALAEKAEHEQGEYPQRFWCSKRIVKCCRNMSSCIIKTSRCMTYLFCCQCCCCCCKSRGDSCKTACCSRVCCCLFWCDSAEEVHPEDALELEKAEAEDDDDDHSRSTVSRAKKINPYLIKKHPHIIHTAVGHPKPMAPPKWIEHRNLDEEFDDRDSDYSISTKKTPYPETFSRSESGGYYSSSGSGSGSGSEYSSSESD